MTRRFLVVGVGGLAKEMTDLAVALGHEVVAYYTEKSAVILHPMEGVTVINDLDAVVCDAALIAVGDTSARKRFADQLAGRYELPALIHPSACVSSSARIGEGVLVMQNVVINADAEVGAGALLNVGCCVAHDCRVGAYSHLAPCVQLGGGSSVGTGVFCGTSAVVLPNVNVGDWTVCGAGSVVTKDVPERSLAVGVPARVVRSQ